MKDEEFFRGVLTGKKIPILTLDNKWHQLFTQRNKDPETMALVEKLNNLLAEQGQLNNDIRDIKRLKAKLMEEIVSGMDGVSLTDDEMADHKRLINDCNEKIDEKQDLMLDYPKEIDDLNFQLMLKTMQVCYATIEQNNAAIEEIAEWIANVRVELKKNVIRKQEKEWMNNQFYAYMHDIFGPEVIDIFDLQMEKEEKEKEKNEKKQEGEKQPEGGKKPESDKKGEN
ncbi:MAG: hypothetical protein K6G07_08070 [Lachnospiraceae bacterium]|nr:hypothetical protein [Lachnospiraceae bacterium]